MRIFFVVLTTVSAFGMRNTILNKIVSIGKSIIDQTKIKIIQTFFYGNPTYSSVNNELILDVRIKYILEIERLMDNSMKKSNSQCIWLKFNNFHWTKNDVFH